MGASSSKNREAKDSNSRPKNRRNYAENATKRKETGVLYIGLWE